MSGVEGVSFGLYFPTGSRHESPRLNGISHFIEHLVFKGTPGRTADEVNREIDWLGGASNAYTTKELVCLHTRVLSENLPRAFEFFADLATESLPAGIEPEVERERTVILSEIRSTDDSPEDLVGHLIDAAFYGDHPLGMPVTGSAEVVSALSMDDLRRHYRERIVGNRVVVAAAGAVDHDELVARVKDRLNGSARALAPDAAPEPLALAGRHVLERDLEQVQISLSGPGVSARDPRWAAAELLSLIVGDGYSSRLFREVRDRRGLAYSVYSSMCSYTDVGSFNVDFAVAPERLAESLEVVSRVLAGVRDGDLTEAELAHAQQSLRGATLLGHEFTGARMAFLADQVLDEQPHLEIGPDLEAIAEVTLADLRALAAELLDRPLALAAVGPAPTGTLPEGALELPR
jgi:predicted Zn-dependent peptidase